jgi:hypothetical protein
MYTTRMNLISTSGVLGCWNWHRRHYFPHYCPTKSRRDRKNHNFYCDNDMQDMLQPLPLRYVRALVLCI